MLRVWIDDQPVGRLDRYERGVTFVYDEGVDPSLAVSLTMPVRTASYDSRFHLLPAFDTNLPEGILRAKLQSVLAKSRGKADSFDILALTGSNQIGRVRVLPEGMQPCRRNLVGDIGSFLHRNCTPEFVEEMLERFGLTSGVSGVMPKVLVSEDGTLEPFGHRVTVLARDFILKFADRDYPGLAMNEFFCLEAARRAGIVTATALLSDDGNMLAVRRFDEKGGRRLGFEDFCALNAKVAEDKYDGSLETSIFKRLTEFSDISTRSSNLELAYRITVMNVALRNGDAHLKNFGLLFEDAEKGPVWMAPAYDIVTTKAYIREDMMALSLGGTKRWPAAKALASLGLRAKLGPAAIAAIFEDTAAALRETLPYMRKAMQAHGFDDVGEAMETCWKEGVTQSLGLDWDQPDRSFSAPGDDPEP